MAKFDVCLEIDPGSFVLVIGPNFTTSVIRELSESYNQARDGGPGRHGDAGAAAISARTPTFALNQIIDAGIRVLLDSEEYSGEAERSKCELLYRNAYELDPQFALKKVSMGLHKSGRYAEWLRRLFEIEMESQLLASHSASLHRVVELQNKGARLIYVHCDDVLSRASHTSPILLEDPEGLDQWLKGEKRGFLHVHGVYWEPDTVKLDGQFYENFSHYQRPATERLKLLFQERHSIMIGCESQPSDPLLNQFIKEYILNEQQHPRQHQPHPHTFHLPLTSIPSNQMSGLPIDYTFSSGECTSSSCSRQVHSLLCTTTESTVSLCKLLVRWVDRFINYSTNYRGGG